MAEEKAKKTIAVETKVPEAKAKTEIQSDADVEAAPGESAAAAHWAEADGVATTKTRSAVSDGLTVGSQWNHDSFSSIPAETVSPSASDDLDEVFQSEQKEGELSTGGRAAAATLDNSSGTSDVSLGIHRGCDPIEGGYAEMSESVWSRQEGGRVSRSRRRRSPRRRARDCRQNLGASRS